MARRAQTSCGLRFVCHSISLISIPLHSLCSGAFRLNRLAAKTFEGKDVTGCNGPAFTSADVPQDLLSELGCEATNCSAGKL